MSKLLHDLGVVVLAVIALYVLFIAAVGSASPGVFVGAVVVLLVSVAGLVALRRRSATAE